MKINLTDLQNFFELFRDVKLRTNIISAIKHVIKKLWRKKRHNTYSHFIMPLFIINKQRYSIF